MSKIVIIEENTFAAELYQEKWLVAGHEVKISPETKNGLELIREFKPDLVLLDLMAPGLSGDDVIRELRQDEEFANLSLVAYSSGDEDILEFAREAGATRTVSKVEASSEEFFEQIGELLEPAQSLPVAESANATSNDDVAPAAVEEKVATEPRGRVLIVEDDKIIATIVKSIVEGNGFEAVMAEDGREAYRILAADANFAAGIFDVQVPFIKGPDLVRHMRTEKRLMRIPVMIMTADETVRVQLDSLSAGAAVFVPKPFERQAFESLFVGIINKASKEKAAQR